MVWVAKERRDTFSFRLEENQKHHVSLISVSQVSKSRGERCKFVFFIEIILPRRLGTLCKYLFYLYTLHLIYIKEFVNVRNVNGDIFKLTKGGEERKDEV